MAEIRKHHPRTGSDIGEQVRALMGEAIRPVEPGSVPGPADAVHDHEDDDAYDPYFVEDADAAPAPVAFSFDAAKDGAIGTAAAGLIAWTPGESASD